MRSGYGVVQRQRKANGLIADDDKGVRETTAILLANAGYRVKTAADGDEALEYFVSNRDDVGVVILDMVMPNLSGRETFAQMRKINPEQKIFLMSGYSVQEETRQLLADGALEFLQKPVAPKALIEKIGRALSV